MICIKGFKEEEIVLKLRKHCDDQGKEIDTAHTAPLLRDLGVIYRNRSPDKLSLIQGCALLNAALVRKTEGGENIREDLIELCSHVLYLAEIEQKNVNLVDVAESFFKDVKKMRTKIFSKVEKITSFHLKFISQNFYYEKEKANNVQKLQTEITHDYSSIMKTISDYVVSILGKPPCSYCHMGLGSLARKEITPFSDFESVIVLEENVQHRDSYFKVLEYFRWFTVIFQILILNFGETIIPSVAIPSLNNFLKKGGNWFFDAHTPRGMCFDGLMPYASKTPLGRQMKTPSKQWKTELIKPVSEMIKYLSSEEDIKNGYHLADILTTTCFVSGDLKLWEWYQQRVSENQKQNPDFVISKQNLDQLEDDLKAFSVLGNLSTAHSSKALRTKQMVYRSSTLFISFLGKLHQTKSTSSFEIITELEDKKVITSAAAHNLRFAVAVACDVRLRTYIQKKAQSEVILLHCQDSDNDEDPKGFEKIVSNYDLINYFKITFCLQKTIREGYREKYEDDMRTVGKDVDCAVLFYLLQYEDAYDFALELREAYLLKEKEEKVVFCTSFIKECLFRLQRYSDALEESRNELSQRLQLKDADLVAIADCKKAVGKCLFKLKRFVESSYEREGELKIRKNGVEENKFSNENVMCIREIAYSFFSNQRFDLALKWFNFERLEYEKDLTKSATNLVTLSECLKNIAGCYFKMSQYSDAITKYMQAKDILLKLTNLNGNAHYRSISDCWRNSGHCYYKLKDFFEALLSYEKELALLNKDILTAENTSIYIDCLTNIAECYFSLKDYKKATDYYRQALGSQKTNPFYFKNLRRIATCFFNMKNYEEALKYHQLEYDSLILLPKKEVFQEAQCLRLIAIDLFQLNKIENSLRFSKEELKLRHILDDEDPGLYTARCLNAIASCYVCLNDYKKALANYEKELKIRKHCNYKNSEARHIADIEHNIILCQRKLA